jgi:glycosyltransferase involved in cell wall biosynthesis
MDAKELMEKNLTIITLNHPDITDFATTRNAELAKAKTPWVLFLDSDEALSPELEQEIASTIHHPQSTIYSAYSTPRLDTFLGRYLHHGEPGHTRLIRLAHQNFGKWVRPVHEQWVGKGKIGHLAHPLIHHSHKSIATFLDKINLYSTLEAEYRFKQGIRSSLFKIAMYPIAKFKWNYIFKLGFLDGVPGTIMAIMMSFHSYLTWTKLYLLWHKK